MLSSDPFVADFGTSQLTDADCEAHFAFIGATGSGKTLMMRILQQTVLHLVGQMLGVRALVYDAKHDALPILSAYISPEHLYSMDPFDARGVAWDIAADVTEPRIALELAFTMIPEQSESQPYFANAARHLTYLVILSFMLRNMRWTLADVLRALSSPNRCHRVLSAHPYTANAVGSYFSDKRRLDDIFTTIDTKMLLYGPIAGCWDAAPEKLSLNDWINNEGVLILGNSEITRTAIDNINRCIFKCAANLLLAKQEGTSERTWFFLDEISEAGQLHSLKSLLKKGRSKGGRVAMAFQSISGLRDPKVYGQYEADDMLGQIGNRFFGRIECPETAEYASRVVGEQEKEQSSRSRSESSSPGQSSNATVSTSVNYSKVINRAVLPSEFMSLPPCGSENGLSGMFTTRSHRPYWDRILPVDLFGGLIPANKDVPNFIPRDPMSQLVMPWTPEQQAVCAPRRLRQASVKRRRREVAQNEVKNAVGEPSTRPGLEQDDHFDF